MHFTSLIEEQHHTLLHIFRVASTRTHTPPLMMFLSLPVGVTASRGSEMTALKHLACQGHPMKPCPSRVVMALSKRHVKAMFYACERPALLNGPESPGIKSH